MTSMVPADELPPWLDAPLRLALQAQRGHALLVHGEQGAGQWPFALALARAWLCEAAPAERPAGLACGRCGSCHLARDDQVHPDLCVLLPEALHVRMGWWQRDDERDKIESAARKPSEWIRIEQVRAAIAFAGQTRSRARQKVILIHPAERLQAIAASALLKLLEEPLGGLRLVLATADAPALLPTVRSRCQALALAPPEATAAAQWLEQSGLQGAAELLAAGGGHPLAALERSAQGLDASLWRRLPALVAAGDVQPMGKLPLPLAIECLHKFCHDAMAVAVGAAPRFFPVGSFEVRGASLAALSAWARELGRCARHAEHPWNATLLLESLLAQGRRALAGQGDSVHSER